MPIDLRFDADETALFTDLYELTVSAVFFDRQMNDTAAFEMRMRRMPPNRGFMIAAGAERLLEALEEYRFDTAAMEYLASLALFKPAFLDYLANFRFTGAVRAMPEGTLFFPGEPILEICAPLIEGQLLETLVLNQIGFASVAATKAARCAIAAGGRRLVDFGPRRAQGVDAAMIAARSSYIGGFAGSSNVLAGRRYGIPVFGTMSHSMVMACERERDAFEAFAANFPKLSTLIVDTYDTIRGVENAAAVGARLREANVKLAAVRLDSGELGDLATRARRILDHAGLGDTAIFASGNLDEYRIAELLAARAPIDAFGIGTALAVSDDAPSADFTYKLVEYAGKPRVKLSSGKISVPGRKQVFRMTGADEKFAADLIGAIDETPSGVARMQRPAPAISLPLLEPRMEAGRRIAPRASAQAVSEARERAASELKKLDGRYLALRRPAEYPVKQTSAVNAMVISEKVRAETRQE